LIYPSPRQEKLPQRPELDAVLSSEEAVLLSEKMATAL